MQEQFELQGKITPELKRAQKIKTVVNLGAGN